MYARHLRVLVHVCLGVCVSVCLSVCLSEQSLSAISIAATEGVFEKSKLEDADDAQGEWPSFPE